MQFIKNLLAEQRKRALGTIMRHVEVKVYPKLTQAERDELRAKIMGALGQYHDTTLDILKSSVDEGGVVNEEALGILRRLDARRGIR